MEQNLILLLLLAVGLVYVWYRISQRKLADGRAKFWATVSEPLFYVSADIDDEGVSEKAEHARKMLAEHGNPYLTEADVWEEVYSASPLTTSRDFSAWQDLVLLNLIKRREQWRAIKAQYNQTAARQMFGGQTIQWATDGSAATDN